MRLFFEYNDSLIGVYVRIRLVIPAFLKSSSVL